MACFSLLLLMVVLSFHSCSAMSCLPNSSVYFSPGNITTWANNNHSLPKATKFKDGSLARFILFKEATGSDGRFALFGFGFGFSCNRFIKNFCDLSILFVEMRSRTVIAKKRPTVVWSANWNRPFKGNATLKFYSGGNLSLIAENGTEIWSSRTAGADIVGMELYESGNMKIFDRYRVPVWDSSSYPTDTVLLNHLLMENMRLTSRIPSVCASQGLFYLTLDSPALAAFVAGDKPIRYITVGPLDVITPHSTWTEMWGQLKFVQFIVGGIRFYFQLRNELYTIQIQVSKRPATIQLLKLDVDGGLRIYGWKPRDGWREFYLWAERSDECWLPFKCGKYGVCKRGKCYCPVGPNGTDYFTLTDDQNPNHGCRPINSPESTLPASGYEMIHFGNLSCFRCFDPTQSIHEINTEGSCKQACKRNTSCKGAIFAYNKTNSEGFCYMLDEILSLLENPHDDGWYASSYLKVTSPQMTTAPPGPNVIPPSNKSRNQTLLAVYAFLLATTVLVTIWFLLRKKLNHACKQKKYLKTLASGTLTSFSYGELSHATAKFAVRLGGGGFGAVYKGILKDGTIVAVKRLEKTEQGIQEFLAEVETIGNIHHINLVKLIGFCIEKRHRILVYEYMCRGSLDNWIFHENSRFCLDWETRKNIVLDIAKGLAYLHGDCRQVIAHLDVKPQNILLDDNFNAKISDFGLSKLINRDQSQVLTRIRGTLGYLAPEWQHSRITVKADIYSYGIVLLEVVTGRKVLDYSQPDSDVYLLNLLKKKSQENQLMDIIDLTREDLLQNIEDVFAMIMLGLWCVNEDHTRRPSMHSVVKMLEEGQMPQPAPNLRFPLVIPASSSDISAT